MNAPDPEFGEAMNHSMARLRTRCADCEDNARTITELVAALGRMLYVAERLDEYIRTGDADNQQRQADEAAAYAREILCRLAEKEAQ